MGGQLSPSEFVAKWKGVTRSERAASQSHFIDICRMLDVAAPLDADPHGDWYAFEKGAEQIFIDDPDAEPGDGFADVWKREHFAWEYKGKRKNLEAAYKQLLRYRESLENPPLLVVCDLDRFEVHTNFTGTIKQKREFDLDALKAEPAKWMGVLRAVLTDPEQLRPEVSPEKLTEHAAGEFVKLADQLRGRDHDPHAVAHFLSKLLFCLFAEDAGLLPRGLIEKLAENHRLKPERFNSALQDLFAAMTKSGGTFGAEVIEWFNGGLFDSDEVLPLETDEIDLLRWVGVLDWSQIEPAIFGTLFERLLDPDKRGQLGAHYTDKESIDRVVQPVLIDPLRREFEAMKGRVLKLLEKKKPEGGAARPKTVRPGGRVRAPSVAGAKDFHDFLERLRSIRVLDPACGSGNFLYVALRELKNLEREAIEWGSLHLGLTEVPRVDPSVLLGIEINDYAAELARVTIWIGEIQWMLQNGFSYLKDPILQPLDNILNQDALLSYDEDGKAHEAEWPEAEFIIGNPPFLGSRLLRRHLGSEYVEDLFKVFRDRVPGAADLVVYWHEKARALVEEGRAQRVGLLATQGIRGGASRRVLDRIKKSGDIFMAWSDERWVVEGAAVQVSIIGFDDGSETSRILDGAEVTEINPDLTTGVDLTAAVPLVESMGIAFYGDVKAGPFDISDELATLMLKEPNPDGRSNKDVIKPWINATDIVGRPRNKWVIDFGVDMSLDEAAKYEAPFEHVKEHVKPVRDQVRRARYRDYWWLHAEPVVGMREAIAPLPRFIVTPQTSKHRLFAWVTGETIPDHAVVVIARADDYMFGVLHSRFHELWARRKGTQLREAESGARYTPTTTVETFPFPLPTSEGEGEIGSLAAELAQRRADWINPPDISSASLETRTLTNLYNEPPTWLLQLHEKLNAAVAAAYGWLADLTDDEILERLLALNLERAGGGSSNKLDLD